MSRTLLTISILLLAFPALAQTALDGWNGYKFGMSPDDARAVPGLAFGRFAAKNFLQENIGSMAGQKPVTLYGAPYKLNLFFADSKKLNQVALENETRIAQAACEKTFLSTLAQMEKTYGALSPVDKAHAKKDGDVPPASVEWKAQGASHYQLTEVAMDEDTGYLWKARKLAGRNYVDLRTNWIAKEGTPAAACITSIDFFAK